VALTVDLSEADWSIREALGETWRWYTTAKVDALNNVADVAAVARRSPGWIPANVPGAVIADLHSAGELPDPYFARNSKFAEWVAERHWVYRTVVELPEFESDERVLLEFDGIDPGGIILWDGVEVGGVDGLFRPVRIEVDRVPGAHVLAVVVLPSPQSEPQVGRTENVRVHAPRMNYGWDFSPRLLHQGIWKGARVRAGRQLLRSVTARTTLTEDLETGTVTVDVEADGPVVVTGLGQSATLDRSGSVTLEVHRPQPWHPIGRGVPFLHRIRVSTGDDFAELDVGFRHVRFEHNPGSPAGALPYTAIVNGEALPLVGWNWAPVDTLYGTITRERIEHLVDLAARSGARLLRVWGGGLLETEDFYSACDRAGLFVWQEFSQSSSGMQSAPAADHEFVEYLRAEAEAIVPARTHHPSLLMWGGGNELDEGGIPLDEERSPALAALREVVQRLDPGRHWVATSPTGPVFHNRLDVLREAPDDQHDVHGPWEHQGLVAHHELYNEGNSLAHTEFGVEGMTNLRNLEALIPPESRWPTDRSNPLYRHLGEWWNNAVQVNELFGGRIDTIERMQRASQFLQATGLAYAVESDRRRSPRCSMVLPWQLAESYPNAWCTSVLDYRGDAKDAYYSVSRAFLPNRVTVKTDRSAWDGFESATAEAWVWSERGTGASTVRLRMLGITGEVLGEETWSLGEVTSPLPVGSLSASISGELFAWEAVWSSVDGSPIDRDLVLATSGAHFGQLLDLAPATVSIELGSGSLVVTHLSGPLVPGLRIVDARPASAPGWLVLGGDPRPLLPGESRAFRVEYRPEDVAVPANSSRSSGRDSPEWKHLAVRLEGWNIEARTITVEAQEPEL
jgi:beta-mannosidase